MNITDIIKMRKSVRSFSGTPLNAQQIAQINQAIAEAKSPFGGDYVIKLSSVDADQSFKPSTYGVITNAKDFLLMGVGDTEHSALSAGYAMEQVVLKATEMGLGTCWIAATFKKSIFERVAAFPEATPLKIISPIGEPAQKRSFMEKFTRFAVGADNRKPFDKLFFAGNFTTPLSPDNQFGQPLEMMRLAPSSTNSQPWRALVVDNRVDFYYKSRGIVSVLDMGIGLCHFNLSAQAVGLNGTFAPISDPIEAPDKWVYLTSFSLK